LDIANSLLPEGFEMIKTKIKENDEAKYYGIFGCFTKRGVNCPKF
jgi:hypothetical protein